VLRIAKSGGVPQPSADVASSVGKGRTPRPEANDATRRAAVATVANTAGMGCPSIRVENAADFYTSMLNSVS
jgi:hypothetical protein